MERIVQQLASFSYSPFLLLPAPHVAGLLPPRCSAATETQIGVVQPRQSLRDRRRAMWAAQDAQLEAFLDGARQRLAAVHEEFLQESARHPARPFIWEMAS